MRAWGQNRYGQVGDGTSTESRHAHYGSGCPQCRGDRRGAYRSVAVLADGTVMEWGADHVNLTPRLKPAVLPGARGIKSVVAGNEHVAAITETGQVMTWGQDSHYQTGRGSGATAPGLVRGITGVSSVAAGAGIDHRRAGLRSDDDVGPRPPGQRQRHEQVPPPPWCSRDSAPRRRPFDRLVEFSIQQRPAGREPESSEAFEDAGGAHAAADAHRHEAVAGAAAAHLVDERRRQLGAGAAEGVAERDRAAVDVEAIRVDRQLLADTRALARRTPRSARRGRSDRVTGRRA